MFCAGALVGGAVVIAAAHGDYSDHDNYGDHRQYGDAQVREQVESKKRALDNFSVGDSGINDRFVDGIRDIQQNQNYSVLDNALNNPGKYANDQRQFYSEINEDMKKQIEAGIAEDQAELEQLDAMINKINQIQLKMKKD